MTGALYMKSEIDSLVAGVSIPSGVILMWSGTLANIPSGWKLCDGSEGTPDLREKFLMGARAGQNPGTTGGAVNKTTAGHVHAQTVHAHSVTLSGNTNPDATTGGNITGASLSQTGHSHAVTLSGNTNNSAVADTGTKTDSIADIRPPYYEIAFIMKV
jgi:hypothetical protein